MASISRLLTLPLLAAVLMGVDGIDTLGWSTRAVHIPDGSVTVTPPRGTKVVVGHDAEDFHQAVNSRMDLTVQAAVWQPSTDQVVYIDDRNNFGYVKSDDWSLAQPDDLLKHIKSEKHTLGWLEKPSWDAATHTLRYAVVETDVKNPRKALVNAVATVLNRYGYDEFTWSVPRSQYVAHGGLLDRVMAGTHLDKGARYEDYTENDHLSPWTLAVLAGAPPGTGQSNFSGQDVVTLLRLLKIVIVAVLLIVGAAGGAFALNRKRQPTPPAQ